MILCQIMYKWILKISEFNKREYHRLARPAQDILLFNIPFFSIFTSTWFATICLYCDVKCYFGSVYLKFTTVWILFCSQCIALMLLGWRWFYTIREFCCFLKKSYFPHENKFCNLSWDYGRNMKLIEKIFQKHGKNKSRIFI